MARQPQTIDGVVDRWRRRGFRFGQQQAQEAPDQQPDQGSPDNRPSEPPRQLPESAPVRTPVKSTTEFTVPLDPNAPPNGEGRGQNDVVFVGDDTPESRQMAAEWAGTLRERKAKLEAAEAERTTTKAVAFRRQVAEELVEKIQQGTAPWQKPWDPSIGNHGMPRNAISGRAYHGMNSFILEMKSPDGDPRWMTYKQAEQAGWQVKPGGKGTKIEYWQRVERDPDRADGGGRDDAGDREPSGRGADGKDKDYLVHRTYTVFHASQVDGIPPLEPKPLPPEHERFEKAEQVALSVGAPVVESKGGRAAYSPQLDQIQMPPRGAFKEAGGYESVLLHEAGHATGHKSRLNRDLMNSFGSPDYAKEELRAEMTSAILSRELGVPHDPSQHASYAASWAKAVQQDPNELFKAASEAQKMAGWMVDRARERGVEIDSDLGVAVKAGRSTVGQDRAAERTVDRADTGDRAPAETPVKVLGDDVRRWTGRVTEISDDRSTVTMRAAGRDTVVKMPDGQSLPDGVKPGVYGKLSAGRDGEAPSFAEAQKKQEKSRQRGRDRGQGQEITL